MLTTRWAHSSGVVAAGSTFGSDVVCALLFDDPPTIFMASPKDNQLSRKLGVAVKAISDEIDVVKQGGVSPDQHTLKDLENEKAMLQDLLAECLRVELAAATKRQTELETSTREIEVRLATETNRAKAAEEDNARLLKAVQAAQAARMTATAAAATATAPAAAITHDVVESRYNRARDLVNNGSDAALALQELLWARAGLPARRAWVGVGPPFAARGPSLGSMRRPPTPARSWWPDWKSMQSEASPTRL